MTAEENRSDRGPAMSGGWSSLVLTLRFATELATLAVLAWAPASASMALGWRIALAVLGPVLVAVVWGLALAPRARHRFADPWRLGAEMVIFLVATAAVALTGEGVAAAVYAVIAIGTAILVRVVTPGS
ncbi:MAG TPA: YrdB family protein [Streptosporangiaceae bacterium]|nr:YrdB family protein [Streptosporangiaceae bacterium]